MDSLTSLPHFWLPILISAVAVWFISAIVWMVLPHHKRDWIALPPSPNSPAGEDAFMDALRKLGIPSGNYIFPDCRGKAAMDSPKVKEAIERGPIGHLSIWPAPLTMADKMVWTFLLYLTVSIGIAFLTHTVFPTTTVESGGVVMLGTAGPDIASTTYPAFMDIFRIAATGGVLAYAFSFIPNMIWFGAYKRTIIAGLIDGIAYGLLTGAIFAWLWPTP